MTNQTPTAADQQPLVQKLTGAQELYTLLSLCSKAPYVMCDAETFDDEIFLFFNEADAKAEMEQRMSPQARLNWIRSSCWASWEVFTR